MISGITASPLSPGIASPVAPAPTASESPHADAVHRIGDAWMLGETLELFGKQFDIVTSRMRAIRPDLADAPYDLKLDQGKLSVVDDALDERSRIWIEESVNGDRELVRLAKTFNEMTVDLFAPKNCPPGSHQRPGRSYDKLDSTIDRSTRFVSMLKDVARTTRSSSFYGSEYQRAAGLVERQIIDDTYAYQAKGSTIELMRNMTTPPLYEWI